jgi:hypothetical protein
MGAPDRDLPGAGEIEMTQAADVASERGRFPINAIHAKDSDCA